MGVTTSSTSAATYVPIQSQTLANNTTSTVTFSSIPATYTDLILIYNGSMVSGGASTFHYQFNSDTGSNYSITRISGSGSSATSDRYTSQTNLNPDVNFYNNSTNIAQIMNYSNTTTYKTALFRNAENYSSASIRQSVGLWRSTSAINRIDIFTDNLSVCYWTSGTTFTLYGIKAA